MVDSPFILSHALNFSRSDTAICAPLFMRYPDNCPYLGVMDSELRISEFQPLHDFERFQISLPGDAPIPYAYQVGDLTPLVLKSNSQLSFVHANDKIELLKRLNELSSGSGDIFNELFQNLLASLGRQSLAELAADDSKFIESNPEEEEYLPRPAKLWLDESIRDLKKSIYEENVDGEEASAARFRLLNWAKDYGENATSALFRHFLDITRVMEKNGVFTKDILAIALLRRMSEEIPRSQTATNLIGDFRTRHGRSPLYFASELSEKSDGLFSERAKEVLNSFYRAVESAVESSSLSKMLLFAYAIDDNALWPDQLKQKMESRFSFFSEQLNSYLNQEQANLEILAEIREELNSQGTGYRSADDKTLTRARSLESEIARSRVRHRQTITILDALAKIRGGLELSTSNLDLAAINYQRLGLNPAFIEYAEREYREFEAQLAGEN